MQKQRGGADTSSQEVLAPRVGVVPQIRFRLVCFLM